MAATTASMQALYHLAATDTAALWRLDRTGRRGLDIAYDSLAACGMLADADAEKGADAVSRLRAVFSAALAHGLSSLPIHYLREVCLSTSLAASSADVEEGRLVDGAVVETWAREEATRAIKEVDSSALARSVAMADMRAAATTATKLVGAATVLDALAEAAANNPSKARAHSASASACRWAVAHVDALEAVKAGEWHRGTTTGGYATATGWRAAVDARRKRFAAAGQPRLFVDRLMQEAGVAATSTSYPPETIEDALRLWLRPANVEAVPPTRDAIAARRALMLYYLVDRASGESTSSDVATGVYGGASAAALTLVPNARECAWIHLCVLLDHAPPSSCPWSAHGALATAMALKGRNAEERAEVAACASTMHGASWEARDVLQGAPMAADSTDIL